MMYILFTDLDYVSTSLEFTFNVGHPANSPLSLTIGTIQDTLVELPETFSVTATSTDSNVVITPSSATVTIMDDDSKM